MYNKNKLIRPLLVKTQGPVHFKLLLLISCLQIKFYALSYYLIIKTIATMQPS